MSLLFTGHYVRHGLPFNLWWWGLTFPLGVFTARTNFLYAALKVPLLGGFAIAFFLLLATFWALVATRTIWSLLPVRRLQISAAD
ncbi:MAG: hypothetical protein M0Z66_16595 [Thermaerobacter sp.]|nr:hypothetical protein [Thermaerobacter sp.]